MHKNETAILIGKTIFNARRDMGFKSRGQLVNSTKLKGKITQEGLRKIEEGDRIPKLENLLMIAKVLGIEGKKLQALQHKALEANIMRVARRAGNATVSFRIEGAPVKIFSLPPKRKTEQFVRSTTDQLLKSLEKYGLGEQDLSHIRLETRSLLHTLLNTQ